LKKSEGRGKIEEVRLKKSEGRGKIEEVR